jgi:hypothetical protein
MAAETIGRGFGEGTIESLVVVKGRSGALTVGGKEFSDASWVPFGLEKARLRKFRRAPFSSLLDIVFQGGLQGLHAAAQHAAGRGHGSGQRLPPHLIAELSAGVPSTDELRRAATILGIEHASDEIDDEAEIDVVDPAVAAALKKYEDLALLVARELARTPT